MSDLRKAAEEENDGNEQQKMRSSATIEDDDLLALETILPLDASASTSGVVQDGGMEDFYADIFDLLSNIELPSTSPEQAIVTSSINVPSVSEQQILEKGESSGVKKTKSTAIEKSHSDRKRWKKFLDQSRVPRPNNPRAPILSIAHLDENQRKDSKRSKRDDQPPRSRSAQLHNMSERIRRDRIRRKMKALQDLIPNCNTMMSTGAGAVLQNPYALQAGFQGVQLPQFPSQFMPMKPGIGMGMYDMSSSTALPVRSGIGMGMYGISSSTTLHVMPFPLAIPCQSTVATSGVALVGPMPQMQLPLNPFQPLPSADSGSTLMAAQTSCTSSVSTLGCTSQAETSSLSVPRAAQVPLMNQGPIVSGSSAIVLPSQIITRASSSAIVLPSQIITCASLSSTSQSS